MTLGGVHKIDSDTGELGKGLTRAPVQSRKGEGGIRARESSVANLTSTKSSSS